MNVLNEISSIASIVVVSHRLSTVIGFDRIIVIDRGTIVAEGRHEELIDTCDVYRDLFLPQWEEYLERMSRKGVSEEAAV